MPIIQNFLKNTIIRRWSVLLLISLMLFIFKSILPTILFTFIFTYLMLRFTRFIQIYVKISTNILTIIIYLFILFLIYMAVTKYVPIFINQTLDILHSMISFYKNIPKEKNDSIIMLQNFIDKNNIVKHIQEGLLIILGYLQNLGKITISFSIAFLLSFFFMIEKNKVISFSKLFLKSNFAWFFKDIYYFSNKFVNTFGIVLETQFVIAFFNTILTTIALALLGFSKLFSLSIMIFILSLVPVAGVIMSFIPLSFIAYSQGGMKHVFYIIVTILIIHMFESYVLNPKLLSKKTELPIFYTFVILLISDWLFGVWGLIVGIPIFTFLFDLLGVKKITDNTKLKH